MNDSILVLASNSPRRRQMLTWVGWEHIVQPADIDETPLAGEEPAAYVLRLAEGKARSVGAQMQTRALVIAADTTVADGVQVLGKPADSQEAVAMLKQLRGRIHQVYTAVAVFDPAGGRLETDLCVSQVQMRAYSDEEIHSYVASGDALDKAGAYAIQHQQFHPVINFNGCFASVAGLPFCHLLRTLKKIDVAPNANIPQTCQTHFQYSCPIFERVLNGENVG